MRSVGQRLSGRTGRCRAASADPRPSSRLAGVQRRTCDSTTAARGEADVSRPASPRSGSSQRTGRVAVYAPGSDRGGGRAACPADSLPPLRPSAAGGCVGGRGAARGRVVARTGLPRVVTHPRQCSIRRWALAQDRRASAGVALQRPLGSPEPKLDALPQRTRVPDVCYPADAGHMGGDGRPDEVSALGTIGGPHSAGRCASARAESSAAYGGPPRSHIPLPRPLDSQQCDAAHS